MTYCSNLNNQIFKTHEQQIELAKQRKESLQNIKMLKFNLLKQYTQAMNEALLNYNNAS